MKIKRYVGENTQEIINRLKKEMGEDAVIVSTRTIKRPGFFGLFKKPLIEIIASVDEKNITLNKTSNSSIDSINEELTRLSNLMESFTNNVSFNGEDKKLCAQLEKYRMLMISNGVNDNIANAILFRIENQINLEGKDEDTIKKIVSYNIEEYLGNPVPLDIKNLSGGQKTIFFIGPTGVGKTTTLAKLGAHLILYNKYDIGFITTDTYRIGAVDQLKTYSDILNVPLKVVYTQDDIYKALAEFYEKDFILIDTAGRSHKDPNLMKETKYLLENVKNKEIYLLISATTDFPTLVSIINQYSFLKDYKLIFTKLDEAENLGNILNAKYYSQKSLSYVTTGQNVPDDLETLNVENLANILIEE
jgi:flagellar biosynthesis protein FlhF